MIRWAAFFLATALTAQTTQGLITGIISNALTNKPLLEAQVTLQSPTTDTTLSTQTGPTGIYTFPQLSPGTYRLTVTKPAYQSRAIHTLELTVAGYININFSLRPLDALWERFVANTVILPNQAALSFLGPDLDPAYTGAFDPEPAQTGQLEPSLSAVMDPALIKTIPLTGRDVYTALAYMPGVTADTATGRSLGLSSNGQRPTSSNFLIDGLEDNNHFVGGPSLSVPPEAIQEYRISTSNFSAEYGRTSGQIANAVTARGGNHWHGLAYTNLRNDILNANSYQSNSKAIPRTPLHQLQTGLTAGGPLIRNRLYQFTALEYFRSRSVADPAPYALASQPFIASLPAGSIAAGLFQAHPLLTGQPPSQDGAIDNLRASIGFNRRTALTRLDYQPAANHRVLVRLFGQD
ncbi:MAG: carboxypeptidase regulatory-like domain-containing protein, partial [Bryobacteraceae bacterium]